MIPEPLNRRPHPTSHCALVLRTFWIAVRLGYFGMALGQAGAHDQNLGRASTGCLRAFAGCTRPVARV
jgi:hypothetical protein